MRYALKVLPQNSPELLDPVAAPESTYCNHGSCIQFLITKLDFEAEMSAMHHPHDHGGSFATKGFRPKVKAP